MAIYTVTLKQSVYHLGQVEAESEIEALEKAEELLGKDEAQLKLSMNLWKDDAEVERVELDDSPQPSKTDTSELEAALNK